MLFAISRRNTSRASTRRKTLHEVNKRFSDAILSCAALDPLLQSHCQVGSPAQTGVKATPAKVLRQVLLGQSRLCC